jgi:hypothetical protein
MKSSHIRISHTFHWHDWSILFKVIIQRFLHCLPGQAAHKFFLASITHFRMHFCIESMWSHNKAQNYGTWNLTATTKDRQVHHGAVVLQIGTPSQLHKQHYFSGPCQLSHNPPLYSASYWTVAVTNPARIGENDHHVRTVP